MPKGVAPECAFPTGIPGDSALWRASLRWVGHRPYLEGQDAPNRHAPCCPFCARVESTQPCSSKLPNLVCAPAPRELGARLSAPLP